MSSIVIAGDTSGSVTLQAPAVAGSSVLSLPAVTDTVAGIAATQTLTNKTLTSPTLTTPVASTTIGVGGATASASGAGISFPATQSASTNANTLDDYEEGTWSPAIGGNATYYAQEGYYTKIGNIVYFYGKIIINSKGTGNNFTMTGFPFNANYNIRLNVQYWTLLATNVVFLCAICSGNTQVDFYSTTAAASNVATNTVFGNGTTISFTGFYSV